MDEMIVAAILTALLLFACICIYVPYAEWRINRSNKQKNHWRRIAKEAAAGYLKCARSHLNKLDAANIAERCELITPMDAVQKLMTDDDEPVTVMTAMAPPVIAPDQIAPPEKT